jgi:hypothetical protein
MGAAGGEQRDFYSAPLDALFLLRVLCMYLRFQQRGSMIDRVGGDPSTFDLFIHFPRHMVLLELLFNLSL